MSSRFYEMAKRNYEKGLWNLDMLMNFVALGRITEDEYEEITGQPYMAV